MIPSRFLRHSTLALALAAAHALAAAADVPIYTLQGSGASSAYAGQAITTTGVVTKLNNNGFFIQDLSGDGNPATSDGVFVFTSAYKPAVGSLVRVAGSVLEYNVGTAANTATSTRPLTEISSVTAVTVLGTGYSINPVDLSLPLAEGDSLERYEGMLVRITSPLTVQQNYYLARYGQVTVGVGRHEVVTNRYRPGSTQALALADLQARSAFLLDDGSSTQNINPTPYASSNGLPRAGDTVSNVVGVIDFGLATSSTAGAGMYRLHPTSTPSFTASNPRPASAPVVGGNVRLASMNVLNFFTTFTDGTTADGKTGQGCTEGSTNTKSNCRGADNLSEFQRQRAKIVLALAELNADAVGLMEIQNNGAVAAQNLVDALNAKVGAGTYAVVADPATGTGTDAIKVAMIYKPARLTPVGAALSDTASINDRPPLAQTFAAANGERFTLVVNHLKSKSSCPSSGAGNVDAGDGQGCWNLKRLQQAQQLRTFVAQLQSSSGSADVMLVGDFNAYAQEDPIYDLTSNGLVDQIGRFNTLGYSYVFDGAAGRLDHAIASPSLSAKMASATHWHINADESLAQDYNLDNKQPKCSTCAPDPYDGSVPFRSSDHDPVLMGLHIYKTITGTSGRDVLVGSAGDDIIKGGAGADTLTGGAGSNVFVYTAMTDAGDTITDFVPGKDLLDLRVLLASANLGGLDAVSAGYVKFVASGAHTLVQVDADGPSGAGAARTLVTLQNVSPLNLQASRDLLVR